MNNLNISNTSLFFSVMLTMFAISISYKEKLGLGKEVAFATVRGVVQLVIVGYVLAYIFKLDNLFVTMGMILFMIINAAINSSHRAGDIPNSFKISFISIFVGTIISLILLVVTKAILWTPAQVVPIVGMLASNTMIAIGLVYRNLISKFETQRQQVLEKLALGATVKQASLSIIRESIRSGMQSSIDSTKTVGIVSLPGMMSGLIFAGVDPTEAIRYQIVIMCMLIASTSISAILASYLSYITFYNDKSQLIY